MKPLCFVLMPFGRKTDGLGRIADFDRVYHDIIAPAVTAANLDPIRADEEQVGGAIHKPMFERLMLCDYAVADVTGANPNVYYELGIRHALKPHSTVILFAAGTALPFDLAPLRGLPYQLDSAGQPQSAEASIQAVTARLLEARDNPHDDSPLFQMVADMPRHTLSHDKTDAFRTQIDHARALRTRLAEASGQGQAAVRAIAEELRQGALRDTEASIIVDVFLALRDTKAHADMIALYPLIPRPLQRTRTVRELLGFALNREGRAREAEQVLREIIADFGPSSETNGLLGRVYKDQWEKARGPEARGLLRKAIEAYVTGFEADWRDAYPGVNAVTLMELADPPDPRQPQLLPVVRYAAARKARQGEDYWDHATLLELAVLAHDPQAAETHLGDALALMRHTWQGQTTARNLTLLRSRRQARGGETAWLEDIIAALPVP